MQEDRGQAPDGTPLRLGRYRLVRVISTGGMARVYEARREAIEGVHPRVALKVILPQHAREDAYRQLFINEARVGSMLRHQNIVQVQDFNADEGLFYLVMEYVEGVTLRQAIRHAKRRSVLLPLPLIAEVGRQVCDGLHHAHAARTPEGRHLQLVHRDLKPSNLMLNPQGVVKLLDFGISKAEIVPEREGVVRGTWGYMAPEQAAGELVGPPADLFGLAAVLYEMAALQPLFKEKEPEALRGLLAADEAARRAIRLSGQHSRLAQVLIRALQRDPAARFPSAAAMGRALAELAGDPMVAREKLIRFQHFIVSDQRNSPRSPPGSSATMDQDAAASGSPAGGLPLGVGDVHRPAAPAAHISPAASRPALPPAPRGGVQQLQAILAALFIGAAVGIVGFTGWKVFSQRAALLESAPPPSLTTPEPTPTPAPEPAVASPEPPTPSPTVSPEPTPEPVPEPAPEPVAAPAPAPDVESPPPAPEPAVEPAPEPAAVTPPTEAAGGEGEEAPADEVVVEPEPVALGTLTVSATSPAKVLVDGEFVRHSPLFRHPVPAGTHAVTLQAETGEQVTFNVTVSAGRDVKKVWSFEAGDWVQ